MKFCYPEWPWSRLSDEEIQDLLATRSDKTRRSGLRCDVSKIEGLEISVYAVWKGMKQVSIREEGL